MKIAYPAISDIADIGQILLSQNYSSMKFIRARHPEKLTQRVMGISGTDDLNNYNQQDHLIAAIVAIWNMRIKMFNDRLINPSCTNTSVPETVENAAGQNVLTGQNVTVEFLVTDYYNRFDDSNPMPSINISNPEDTMNHILNIQAEDKDHRMHTDALILSKLDPNHVKAMVLQESKAGLDKRMSGNLDVMQMLNSGDANGKKKILGLDSINIPKSPSISLLFGINWLVFKGFKFTKNTNNRMSLGVWTSWKDAIIAYNGGDGAHYWSNIQTWFNALG
jgi:hypothetical protein